MDRDLSKIVKALLGASSRAAPPTPSIDHLLDVAGDAGLDGALLRRDLEAVLVERIAMWLVGDIDEGLNYDERYGVVRSRLAPLAGETTDPEALGAVIQEVVEAQATISMAKRSSKNGIASITQHVADDVLSSQGYRCAVCGVPLRSRVRLEDHRFQNNVEPVLSEHLDHVLPFYLGGNEGNVRALCLHCNQLKQDLLGVQEDGLILSGNHLLARHAAKRRRRAAFWTLELSHGCAHTNCEHRCTTRMMFVTRSRADAPWVYGNLAVWCSEHAPQAAWWLHHQDIPRIG